MTDRELDRLIRKARRETAKLMRQLAALERMKRRFWEQIARERKRLEEGSARKQRNAEKARERRRRAAEEKRRNKDRERLVQERESMEMEMKDRRAAAESRSKRTKRLIRLGGLTVIAGLVEMPGAMLLGMLEVIARFGNYAKLRDTWQEKGRHAMAAWTESGRDPTRPDLRNLPASESPTRTIDGFTHRLATLGGVIDKAGLGREDAAVVLGILVAIAEHEAGKDWTQLPPADAESRPEPGSLLAQPERLRVTFKRPIARSLGIALGELGLRYKPDEMRWYGTADRAAAEAIVIPAGGTVEVAS